jgi:hypothetical protein
MPNVIAETIAKEQNQKLGVTMDKANEIIVSSIKAANIR